jgi:hypothetical protein
MRIQATKDDILHGVRDIPRWCKKAFPMPALTISDEASRT